MPNSRILTGEARAAHLIRVKSQLDIAADRLGFPIGHILETIRLSPEIAALSGGYVNCESGVWACDATVYLKFVESDGARLGFYAECQVTWGSYSHSLSSASVAIGVYRRAVEMASIIEGLIS